MKKILFILSLAFAVMAFVSCSSDNSPEGVMKEFMSCIKKEKYDKALDLIYFKNGISEEEKKAYAELLGKYGKQLKEKGGLKGIEVTNVEMSEDGESANVSYFIKYGNGTEEEKKEKVVKADGKWMIEGRKLSK